MPEGPELHLASLYVNRMCNGVVFTGPVRKSDVSKSPDVPFASEAYRITAASRGKEVKLTLTPMKRDDSKQRIKAGSADQPMDVVFRFGMSGYFRFTTEDELPKHAHLRFYSAETPCRVLSYVDARRFGSWQPDGTWQADRGPCIMFDYTRFRLELWRERFVSIRNCQRHPFAVSAGRTSYPTCRTGPSTGPSVKSCSTRSTSTASGTTSGRKFSSGNKQPSPCDRPTHKQSSLKPPQSPAEFKEHIKQCSMWWGSYTTVCRLSTLPELAGCWNQCFFSSFRCVFTAASQVQIITRWIQRTKHCRKQREKMSLI